MDALLSGPLTMWRVLPLWFRALIRAMRPKQWTKNVLIFLPIFFDRQFSHVEPMLRVVLGFVLFCFVAGSVYLLNDLVDVERDRLHPKKRTRPIASGELPVKVAIAAAVVLPIICIGVALSYSVPLAIVLVIYMFKQIGYSFYFKHIVIVDVMILALGYILRVIAGVIVIQVTHFSPWLYVCTGMLSLFLAVGKRRQELLMMGSNAEEVRPIFKEYNLTLLDDMLRMVMTSSIIAYTLYTVESNTSFGGPAMLLTVPFLVYGVFRYLYLMHVKGEGGAPDEVLLKDRPLLFAIALFGVTAGIIIYLGPYIIAHVKL
jgi:4-hydroxybenzoate polyprenyltransferase